MTEDDTRKLIANSAQDHPTIATPMSSRLMERMFSTGSKGLRQLMIEDKEKLERVRKEQVAKDLKVKRESEREYAKAYNKEKKKREAEEKRNKLKWGGIVRGFDPNAGLLRGSPASEETSGEPGPARHERSLHNSDSLTKILNPKLGKGQTWGVHRGNPGKDTHCRRSN